MKQQYKKPQMVFIESIIHDVITVSVQEEGNGFDLNMGSDFEILK